MIKKSILSLWITLSAIQIHAQPEADAWTKYMLPAEIHTMLAAYVGNFDLEITMWMTEGEKPLVIQLQSAQQMILGGRFLELSQHGEIMEMPYESRTTIGFNNAAQKFDLTSVTNTGTGMLALSGGWDPVARVAELYGQLADPGTGQPIYVRQQIRFTDENSLLIENFDRETGGTERKTIAYRLTRAD